MAVSLHAVPRAERTLSRRPAQPNGRAHIRSCVQPDRRVRFGRQMHLRSKIKDTESGFGRGAPLSKSDFAHNELRRRIVTGELAPGVQLDLQELCDTLGISRMPMREALLRL